MKYIVMLALSAFSFFMLGCATNSSSETADESAAETDGSGTNVDERTAYEGKTGSGLLMERYRSGQIEGLRE